MVHGGPDGGAQAMLEAGGQVSWDNHLRRYAA
ncbi:Uncharacterised protein [Bordetella pertussis]|nr:Uncharacterised protein [Bordetella pertussis]CRE26832.1 Uncharacterised protein [Bordetella pertussis]